MSDLVEFEELDNLDGGDLRSVFQAVDPQETIVAALLGSSPAVRERLLTKLPADFSARLAGEIDKHAPISVEDARIAQREVVETLCRLGRSGVIAFDDPDDFMSE